MATSVVTSPDGARITVNHPEGESQRSIISYAQEQYKATQDDKASRTTETSSGQTMTMPSDMSFGDAAALGFMDFAENFIPDFFIFEPEDYIGREGPVDLTEVEGQREAFKRKLAGVPEGAEQGLGDQFTRALADPTNLAGSRLPTSIANVALTTANAAAAIAATGVGVTVSEVIQNTDWSPMTKELATAVIAPLLGTLAGAPSAAAASGTVKAGGAILKKVSPDGIANKLAETGIDAKLAAIKQVEGGDLSTRLQTIQDLQDAVPGLKLPFAALASDNPIVTSWLREVSAADVEFRAKFEIQVNKASDQLIKAYDELIQEAPTVSQQALRSSIENRMETVAARLNKNFDAKMKTQDKAETALVRRLSTKKDSVDVGGEMKALAATREKSARDAATVLYDRAIKGATGRGTMVPESTVASVYNLTRLLKLDDLFAGEPMTAQKIQKLWAPDDELQFSSVPVKELDSLKRATNKALRTTRDDTKKQQLSALKDVVSGAIDKMKVVDPTFVDEYRVADSFFLQNVGLPLTTAGMKSISSTKFLSQAAQQLSSFEKAKDYVNFVGEKQGLPILRHSLRLRAHSEGVVNPDGTINDAKLNRFRGKNSRLIDMAKMAPEFTQVNKGLKTIREAQARHTEKYNKESKKATEGFFRAVLEKPLSGVVGDMINNPKKRANYLKQINKLPKREREMALNGVQQGFLDKGMDSPGSMVEFVTQHQDLASDLFSPRHVANIKKLAKVTDVLDLMAGNISNAMGRVPTVDYLQQTTGVSFAETSGLLRNQVLSTSRKVINYASKSVAAKGVAKRENKAGKILLSEDLVEVLANPPRGWKHYANEARKGGWESAKEWANYVKQDFYKVAPIQILRTLEAAQTPREPEEQQQ